MEKGLALLRELLYMNVKGSSLTTLLLAFVIHPPSQAADIMCEQPTLVEYWVQTVTHLISHSSLLGDTTCSPPYSLSLSLSSHTLIALLSSIYFSPCYCSPFIIITGIHFSLHLLSKPSPSLLTPFCCYTPSHCRSSTAVSHPWESYMHTRYYSNSYLFCPCRG